jgi:hypothetical protein
VNKETKEAFFRLSDKDQNKVLRLFSTGTPLQQAIDRVTRT